VPAAAVIPAPRAYINVVAVKKPVVGFEIITGVRPSNASCILGSGEHIEVMIYLYAGMDAGQFVLG
jgi:hypothetical protein